METSIYRRVKESLANTVTVLRDAELRKEKIQHFREHQWPLIRERLKEPIHERWGFLQKIESSEWLEKLYENPSRASMMIVGGLFTGIFLLMALQSGVNSLLSSDSVKLSEKESARVALLEQSRGLSATKKLAMAMELLQKKKYEAALALFNELSIDPKKNQAKAIFYGMSTAYLAEKEYAYALGALFRLNQIIPKQAETEYRIGVVLLHKANTLEAKNHFERALALNPRYPGAREILQKIDVAVADFHKKEAALAKARKLRPAQTLVVKRKNPQTRTVASASGFDDVRTGKMRSRRE